MISRSHGLARLFMNHFTFHPLLLSWYRLDVLTGHLASLNESVLPLLSTLSLHMIICMFISRPLSFYKKHSLYMCVYFHLSLSPPLLLLTQYPGTVAHTLNTYVLNHPLPLHYCRPPANIRSTYASNIADTNCTKFRQFKKARDETCSESKACRWRAKGGATQSAHRRFRHCGRSEAVYVEHGILFCHGTPSFERCMFFTGEQHDDTSGRACLDPRWSR